MTGRGSGNLAITSDDPAVVIGLSLSTSPSVLSLSSPSAFLITVTARILSTPHPDLPITLQTHPSALDQLSNRSFKNIECIGRPGKFIEIFPRGWPQYHWDMENLRPDWSFVTVPSQSSGQSLTISHEVPPGRIKAAELQKGERYRVQLTDICLGTRWWAFKSLKELENVRLKTWKSEQRLRREREEAEQTERDDPELAELERREREEKEEEYGHRPTDMGEDPYQLGMVAETDAEFEIV